MDGIHRPRTCAKTPAVPVGLRPAGSSALRSPFRVRGRASARAVARGVNTVQPVVADGVVLPADRVVQGVGAHIAPMAVQIVLFQGGARASQLEQLVARQQRRFGGHGFGLGHGDRGRGDRFFVRGGHGSIDETSGAFQQGVRGVDADLHLADLVDGQRVLVAVLLAAVDPRPSVLADETDRVRPRVPGDAGSTVTGVDAILEQS